MFVFIWVIGELREVCAKFWKSLIKIHGEKICQSWPLLTSFYSGPIVQWLYQNASPKVSVSRHHSYTVYYIYLSGRKKVLEQQAKCKCSRKESKQNPRGKDQ